nr:flagellar hook capping FlgD N-terminal domain-containing protein [Sedimentibacter sp.]
MQINTYNVNSSASAANNSLTSSSASLEMNDFLNLLVAQMKNQDAMNPMDNTEFVSQLAQFSSLQAMSNLEEMSKQSQATSLIGKTVVMASYDDSGDIVVTEGAVEKVTIYGGETILYVNGEAFGLSNIMEIKAKEDSNVNVVEETLDNILKEIVDMNSKVTEPDTETNIETETEADIETDIETDTDVENSVQSE